jgi:hypothetical protein
MDIKPYDVIIREEPTVVQKLYRFPNGLGASVIKGEYTYGNEQGMWELAVIEFEGDGFKVVYPKDICPDEDVVGWLTDEQVDEKLVQIANLEGAGNTAMNNGIWYPTIEAGRHKQRED